MKKSFVRFIKDESGVTSIEYVLVATGISIAIVTALQALRTNVEATYTCIGQSVATRADAC